jgi:hypothetical protein
MSLTVKYGPVRVDGFTRIFRETASLMRRRHQNGDRDPLYPVEMACEIYRAIAGSRLWMRR